MFLFLDANQDAILNGERLNVPRANSVMYAACAMGCECEEGNALNVTSFRKACSRADLQRTDR